VLLENGTIASWGAASIREEAPPELDSVVGIAAGGSHAVVIQSDGKAQAWGFLGDWAPPAAGFGRVVAADGAWRHAILLREDGSVVCIGANNAGQCDVPADLGPAIAVTAANHRSFVVKANGTLAGWGPGVGYGEDYVPTEPNIAGVAAGMHHNVAFRQNGTVFAWGRNNHQQCTVPADLDGVVDVDVGYAHSVARRSDGTVVCWGRNNHGQATVPAGLDDARDLAAGYWHTVAARSDGSVVCWGSNNSGQCNVPAEAYNIVQVAAGSAHTIALRSDGLAVAWQSSPNGFYDPALIPENPGTVDFVAAGENFSVIGDVPSCVSFKDGGDGDDCDGNGVPDYCDIESGADDDDGDGRLDACEFAAGDLDLDGAVGAADLAGLLAEWNAGAKSPADFDRDGIVGAGDLAFLLSRWGPLP
jgi:alpha-tubulin suppressor-like RCC1 family protein